MNFKYGVCFALLMLALMSCGNKNKHKKKKEVKSVTMTMVSSWPTAQRDSLIGKMVSDAPAAGDTLIYHSDLDLYALVSNGQVKEWKAESLEAKPAEPVVMNTWGSGGLCLAPRAGESTASFQNRISRKAEKKKCTPDMTVVQQLPAALDPTTNYCIPCEKIVTPECDESAYWAYIIYGWQEERDLPWYCKDKYGNIDYSIVTKSDEMICHGNDLIWMYYYEEEN